LIHVDDALREPEQTPMSRVAARVTASDVTSANIMRTAPK
jgi:hypothetical protein